jgi:type IV pilus assembly protein PilN
MRIPINLASQPFRRDRAMLAASIAVTVLLCVSLAVLISLAMADRAQLGDVRGDVDRLNRSIRRVSAEQSKQDTILGKVENAEVLEHSVFFNDLLRRKGISWTRIFADLEKAVPYNVRVVQIHPTVDAQNRVVLDMQVASESPEPVIELLKTMSQAPFGNPELKLMQAPSQSEPLYRYRVSVEYAQKL